MNIVGVIAEYNPFHNGHKYQLEQIKEHLQADYCVVIMSGNFVQRGAPAITDKYTRTKMALLNGADLVLELPVYYAVSSAEYFAAGAVALLDRLGIVNCLCFGSECGNISSLERIAKVLTDESDSFSELLRCNLRQGLSYPTARNNALTLAHPELAEHLAVLSSPNNILGIEYLKALYRRKSRIIPFTNQRVGSDYHDSQLSADISSATAIRHSLEQTDRLLSIVNQVPSNVFHIMEESFHVNYPIYPHDISLALNYKLLQYHTKGYTEFADITPNLSDKIQKNLEHFAGMEDFCELLKSKDMTYSRVSRCLLHILLDIRKDTLQKFVSDDFVYYGRILGLKQSSSNVLTAIKTNGSIPLISKLANAETILLNSKYAEHAVEMLRSDIFAAHIYNSAAANKFHTHPTNEYRSKIVTIP